MHILLLPNKKYYISETFILNMLEIKFRGSSSQGHVIHKVNFKVVGKVQRSICLIIRKIMTALDSLSNYLSNNTNFMEIGLMVPEICGLKVRRPRPGINPRGVLGGKFPPRL